MTRDEVVRSIFASLERINELRNSDQKLVCSEDCILFGSGGGLDSLNLVSLILDVEEAINARLGTNLVLANERAMAMKHNPFRDVRRLADYIVARLNEDVTRGG